MKNKWQCGKLALVAGVAVIALFGPLFYEFARPALTEAAACQSIAVPAYSYPNPPTFWDGAINAHPPVSVMIANVNSGPGSSQDSNYVTVINQAQTAGIKVLGYVWTNYGASSTASVEADIDSWKNLYGVKSIMFDGTSSAVGDESYYQTLANYVHANGGIVMLNPGDVPDQGYMNIGDIVNIFEGTQSDYASYTPPSWAKNYTSKIANVIYGVSGSSAMQTVLSESQTDNAGYVYITDEGLPNPYSTLPAYWSTETSQINQNCTPPSQSSGSGGSSGGSTKKTSSSKNKSTPTATKSPTASTTTPTTSTAAQPSTATKSTSSTKKSSAAPTKATPAHATAFHWGPLPIAVLVVAVAGIGLLTWRLRPLVVRRFRPPAPPPTL